MSAGELAQAAVAIAREAGEILVRYHRDRSAEVSLKGPANLVTTADLASEELVIERITARFGDHAILAEESGHGRRVGPYRWVIDPLDGTTNFAHGHPHFSVLIAVQEQTRDGFETVAGITLDPVRDELFIATRGGGATLNGEAIAVSETSSLTDALCSTGFRHQLRDDNDNHREFCRMNLLTHGVRRMGSAGLDLAYVACGRLDIFWEPTLSPWDIAAGALLVTEAGGRASAIRGGPLVVEEGSILGTNGGLHDIASRALASALEFPAASREGLGEFLPEDLR